MAPNVTRILSGMELGEGPHWDSQTQSLYFVDIYGKAIHKYVPSTNSHTKAIIGPEAVSLIIPVEGQDDQFLIGMGRKLLIVQWDGISESVGKMEKLYELNDESDRFNDGKCDQMGRFWGGSMGPQPVNGYVEPFKGSLISYKSEEGPKTHLKKIGISNGLTWSLDGTFFYYIDTHKGCVEQYNYDIKNGAISNPKCIFTLNKTNIQGGLDGMTIDTDGNLWIAIFGGDCIIKIDPRKPETLLEKIILPAHQITSVTFGGPKMNELYVTTAKLTTNGIEYHPPDHGAIYVITGAGSCGLPGARFKL